MRIALLACCLRSFFLSIGANTLLSSEDRRTWLGSWKLCIKCNILSSCSSFFFLLSSSFPDCSHHTCASPSQLPCSGWRAAVHCARLCAHIAAGDWEQAWGKHLWHSVARWLVSAAAAAELKTWGQRAAVNHFCLSSKQLLLPCASFQPPVVLCGLWQPARLTVLLLSWGTASALPQSPDSY